MVFDSPAIGSSQFDDKADDKDRSQADTDENGERENVHLRKLEKGNPPVRRRLHYIHFFLDCLAYLDDGYADYGVEFAGSAKSVVR